MHLSATVRQLRRPDSCAALHACPARHPRCPQALDSRSLSWSPLSRSVWLALKQLISGLIQNFIPCSVVIAHAYIKGVPFEHEGSWAIPRHASLDDWFEPGRDAVAGVERLLLAHGVTVVRAVPAPDISRRLTALESAAASS